MYHAIPAQLARNAKRYSISKAIGREKSAASKERLYDLIDSRTVLVSYNTMEPDSGLSASKDIDSYKLYTADTGLFLTLMFIDRPEMSNDLYARMLSDRLPANLGYLYENAAAQIIQAAGSDLFYHTFEKAGSTHYYEVDFLIGSGDKLIPVEIKSSGTGKHESILTFRKKYSARTSDMYLFSSKDVDRQGELHFLPVYMLPAFMKNLKDQQIAD